MAFTGRNLRAVLHQAGRVPGRAALSGGQQVGLYEVCISMLHRA